MAAVRAIGVAKRFETNVALADVDLVLEEGEVRGLLGPNGAGKTTLLRILLGLVRPDAGSIERFGRSLRMGAPTALEGVAGFVENPSFYPYLSGRANLEALAELDGGASPGRVEQVLERMGLARRARDRVAGYSTGMRQRLGIAASLLRGPRLLLLDEPTAGLDPVGVRELAALVQELSADQVAILLSSHQIVEVEDLCDSFTVLDRGRVVWEGAEADVRALALGFSYRLHTSDDARALELVESHPGVRAVAAPDGGLEVSAAEPLDPYMVALGSAGVAVRLLELLASPVESLFFRLTGEGRIGSREARQLPQPAASARVDG